MDASVAVEYLLRTAMGRAVAPMLDSAMLLAPELLDAEVLAVLRRAVLEKRLGEPRARAAIDDLRHWNVRRLGHAALLLDAWALRANVTAYDALYLAAARRTGATVLTADGPLARAPATGVVVQNVR